MRTVVVFAAVAVALAGPLVSANGPEWSYNRAATADDGPAQWSAIPDHEGQAAYPTCGQRAQSPINFAAVSADSSLGALATSWLPVSRMNVTNNGHTVQVTPLAGGGTATDPSTGAQYRLLQLHFHSASEHLFGGSARDMEMHLVHSDAATGALLVVGVSFVESSVGYNAELATFWDAIATATASGTALSGSVDLSAIVPPSAAYFTYDGSLTTPPCTEGVRWIVMAEPVAISTSMLAAMRIALGTDTMSWPGVSSFVPRGNNRPAQPLNGRTVRAFVPASAKTGVGIVSATTVESATRAGIAGVVLGALGFMFGFAALLKAFWVPQQPGKRLPDIKE